jgi:hypothetical protein
MPPATAGWQQRAGKPQPQIPFSLLSPDSFFFSPYLWWENKRITPACWKTYWNCIAFELGTLGGFLCVCVCVVLFYFMRPLWWDNYKTISEAPSPGLETEMDTQIIKTETSLHLNLEVFWFFGFFLKFSIFHFILIHFYILIFLSFTYFLFLFLSLFFYFWFSILSLSL